MLAPNDQRHIDYCAAHNDGYCMYRSRKCDGICNNCGLDAEPETHPTCNGAGRIEYIPHTSLYFDEPI